MPKYFVELNIIEEIEKKSGPKSNWVSGIHSGNAGDIIYSLPTAISLKINHFIINLCSDPGFGGRIITYETAKKLIPLLLSQPYIYKASIVSGNVPLEYCNKICGINYILDKFRLYDVRKHHLAICHALAFNTFINLNDPWIFLDNKLCENYKKLINVNGKYIVIAFTPRYRSKNIEFWREVLNDLNIEIIALGIPEEFHVVSGIKASLITCKDFLEMACIIKNSSLFIGNPNLPYAIAEGLKVKRIVEVYPPLMNAYPIGPYGYIVPHSVESTKMLIKRLTM